MPQIRQSVNKRSISKSISQSLSKQSISQLSQSVSSQLVSQQFRVSEQFRVASWRHKYALIYGSSSAVFPLTCDVVLCLTWRTCTSVYLGVLELGQGRFSLVCGGALITTECQLTPQTRTNYKHHKATITGVNGCPV